MIFDDNFIKRHPKVVALSLLGDQSMAMSRYNVYKDKISWSTLPDARIGLELHRFISKQLPMEVTLFQLIFAIFKMTLLSQY